MITIWIALATAVIDQLVKWIITTHMELGESIPVVKDLFHLTYIINPGAAFGILPNQQWFFLVVVGGLFATFLFLREKMPQSPRYFPVSVGLLLGGALGNAIDRARISGVVDFFDFRIWPIFNVADIAICVSVGFILLYFWRHSE